MSNADQSQDDALAQPEIRRDSDDDDDHADDVDNVVHEMTFRNYKRLCPMRMGFDRWSLQAATGIQPSDLLYAATIL